MLKLGKKEKLFNYNLVFYITNNYLLNFLFKKLKLFQLNKFCLKKSLYTISYKIDLIYVYWIITLCNKIKLNKKFFSKRKRIKEFNYKIKIYLKNKKFFFRRRNFFKNIRLFYFIYWNKLYSINNYINFFFIKFNFFNKKKYFGLLNNKYNILFNLTKGLLIRTFFLDKLYKNFFYNCMFKKELNNIYITIVNRFGEVIFNYSAGRLGLIKKKQKKAKNIIFLMIPGICYKLKEFRIYELNFYIIPEVLRMHKAVLSEFLKRGITCLSVILLNSVPHNNGTNIKYKKLRRI